MDYKEIYESWLNNPYIDEATKEELRSISGDEQEIKERFYMDLEFGTAGLRGIIGAGTNRMNPYVVRKATQGLANYIKGVGKESQGVAMGPLGVRPAYQSQGAGSLLVEESLRRAKAAGYPWVAVLGSSYYARFGFEPCAPYGITVSEDAFANEHLQILFFQEEAKAQAAGRITYCDAFYDGDGNLL